MSFLQFNLTFKPISWSRHQKEECTIYDTPGTRMLSNYRCNVCELNRNCLWADQESSVRGGEGVGVLTTPLSHPRISQRDVQISLEEQLDLTSLRKPIAP